MPPTPVFILCSPRSFSSVVCTMLGEHPEMYGVPELNLFCVDQVGELLALGSLHGGRHITAGLLRVMAQLHDGEQTVETVDAAEAWLEARKDWSTSDLFHYLVDLMAPRRCIDKSPPYARASCLRRICEAFPDAQFLHLGRHPRAAGNSRHKAMSRGVVRSLVLDPGMLETHWLKTQRRLLSFAAQVPPGQYMYIQGELLLSDPDFYLRQVAEWLGIDQSVEAIEAMKHPESSPYARPGPPNALDGHNRGFLENPALRAMKIPSLSLHGPLEWLEDGSEFSNETKEVARTLGYR